MKFVCGKVARVSVQEPSVKVNGGGGGPLKVNKSKKLLYCEYKLTGFISADGTYWTDSVDSVDEVEVPSTPKVFGGPLPVNRLKVNKTNKIVAEVPSKKLTSEYTTNTHKYATGPLKVNRTNSFFNKIIQ